ncbi:hypothetical protein CLOSTMETH_02946 [[Clostridium] methylpentosum DSM 5476]|uniref:Uncharacterized protein n=1 Tax=[Clostridium] methylpentosum DSM 5476 TaxID=537013 RepID=C0EGF3_9FIRM|nr:hypothetical protein CLOSTMETH_02946 [[Clostridium] methylpentosum DSM 5476]
MISNGKTFAPRKARTKHSVCTSFFLVSSPIILKCYNEQTES